MNVELFGGPAHRGRLDLFLKTFPLERVSRSEETLKYLKKYFVVYSQQRRKKIGFLLAFQPEAAAAATAAALTGGGSSENLLLIGSMFDSMFDTDSDQPEGKRVKATDRQHR